MRRSRFEVRFDWEVEDGVDIELVVSGFQQPLVPAQLGGHPDSRTPAEGGELEDIEIRNERGCRLPADIAGKLLASNRFLQEIEERISGK